MVLGKFETYKILLFLFPPALVMRSVQPSLMHCQKWYQPQPGGLKALGSLLKILVLASVASVAPESVRKTIKIGNENVSLWFM